MSFNNAGGGKDFSRRAAFVRRRERQRFKLWIHKARVEPEGAAEAFARIAYFVTRYSLDSSGLLFRFFEKVLEARWEYFMFRVPSIHGLAKMSLSEVKRRRRELSSFPQIFSEQPVRKFSGKVLTEPKPKFLLATFPFVGSSLKFTLCD